MLSMNSHESDNYTFEDITMFIPQSKAEEAQMKSDYEMANNLILEIAAAENKYVDNIEEVFSNLEECLEKAQYDEDYLQLAYKKVTLEVELRKRYNIPLMDSAACLEWFHLNLIRSINKFIN